MAQGIPINGGPGAGGNHIVSWVLNGSVNAGSQQDGLRPVDKSGTILSVIVASGNRGNAGTALYDINKHVPTKPITTQRDNTPGTTIYTTQANRPDITGSAPPTSNAIKKAAAPDVTDFAAGDFFSLDVDVANGNMKDTMVSMLVSFNGA